MALFARRKTDRIEPPVVVERQTTLPQVPRKRTSGYIAAQNVARYEDFRFSYGSADQELMWALPKLRARARWLTRNNPLARRYLQLLQMNVVGHHGFVAQVRALQPNGTEDAYGNDQITALWKQWKPTATADGLMSLREATNAVVRAYGRDGEAFVQIKRSGRYKHGIALHMVEADQVDDTLNVRAWGPGLREIRMGVEIDADERPVAYHVLTYHPGDSIWHSIKGRKYIRVPAADMLHIYVKERPGQTRGEPPMSSVMLDAKMLAGYREAEITNRRVAASKMGFFTNTKPDSTLGEIADDISDDGDLTIEVEPGQFTKLPIGFDFKQFDPSSSGTDYADFEKQVTRSIAAGLGPSYHDLAMDLEGVSYSSIRQGALTDRDFYRLIQAFIIERFMRPVFGAWLQNVFDYGFVVNIPPRQDKIDKFHSATTFRGRGWAWVDPQKEVSAAVTGIENGLTSRTRVTDEQGIDFADVVAELERERQMMGVTPEAPQEE